MANEKTVTYVLKGGWPVKDFVEAQQLIGTQLENYGDFVPFVNLIEDSALDRYCSKKLRLPLCN